jgi:hypothetical protein
MKMKVISLLPGIKNYLKSVQLSLVTYLTFINLKNLMEIKNQKGGLKLFFSIKT